MSIARSRSECERSVCSLGLSAKLHEAAAFAARDVRATRLAVDIGEVREPPVGTVIAETSYGGSRVIDMLVGDALPRIC